MISINKVTSNTTVDFAAEELKKYLRMMMPECGDIKITYNPNAKDGFCIGLMQDFELDITDADDVELDDILYIDTDIDGGIIAGDNPRSVLLSVYEYLRQNGCRWLFPGVDGEYIPMQNIVPVKYRHMPSCRYRGQCNEGAEFQEAMLETIDFTPKVGMNVYMLEFRIPRYYYESYYNHDENKVNRNPEPVTDTTVLQWKRQCESEISKRGLQFHDIGHGFTVDPFGIDSANCWNRIDDSEIPEHKRKFLAEINGVRGLYRGQPVNTNFCMSNPEARKLFVNYVADYAENHSYIDYLHVWLADAKNNHCECDKCAKKTVSDWYIVLMNEIDRELTRRNINTRIVFIVYLDTTWAPLEEKIENPSRFTLLLAPITRSYLTTLDGDKIPENMPRYPRNKLIMPANLEEYFSHFLEWKKMWGGANLSYEYHFWRHQCYDITGRQIAKRISEDIKVYKAFDVNGIIEDGSQRSFFPTGFAFYTYARTLFDTSLSIEDIENEYFECAFGVAKEEILEYFSKLENAVPYESLIMPKAKYLDGFLKITDIVNEGRKIIKKYYNSERRISTVSVRLLEYHSDFCEGLSHSLVEAAKGNRVAALAAYEKFNHEFGKNEIYIQRYYDHYLFIRFIRDSIKRGEEDRSILI